MNKINELKFDPMNANSGTQRGRGLLEKSLQQYGAGRSILLDKNNFIIAGNKTVETAGQVGIEDVQIVESDGKRIIAVKRMDLDINDPKTKELAIADNRVAEVDLAWDAKNLEKMEADGVKLDQFFKKAELEKIFGAEKEKTTNSELDTMELAAFEKYDYVVLVARNELDIARLYTVLGITKKNISFVEETQKPGVGRIVDCQRLFSILDQSVK